MGHVVVICVREPDSSNEFSVFGAEAEMVQIVDVDLGRADLRDAGEFSEWAESHLATAGELRSRGHGPAAVELEAIVAEAQERNGHGATVPA